MAILIEIAGDQAVEGNACEAVSAPGGVRAAYAGEGSVSVALVNLYGVVAIVEGSDVENPIAVKIGHGNAGEISAHPIVGSRLQTAVGVAEENGNSGFFVAAIAHYEVGIAVGIKITAGDDVSIGKLVVRNRGIKIQGGAESAIAIALQ